MFAISILFGVLMDTKVLANEDSVMLQNLRRLRIKQQDQENLFRVVMFKTLQTSPQCAPVQQTRQRLREFGPKDGTGEDDIVINAGNEELNVTDNHGTINSDVNVNIIKQGNENPCP
jgi:hypothetical protein